MSIFAEIYPVVDTILHIYFIQRHFISWLAGTTESCYDSEDP